MCDNFDVQNKLKECCDDCVYYCSANDSDGICLIADEITYFDTPKCDYFVPCF